MKRLNCTRIRIVLVVCVAATVLGGGSAKADFTFGEPVNLGSPVNTAEAEMTPCLSADGLELYFGGYAGGYGEGDLCVTRRASVSDNWGTPENLGPVVNTPSIDLGPSLSVDGLELYFHSNRPGTVGECDLWVTRRANRNDPWGPPENLGPPVNSEADDYNPCLSADGLELYFAFGKWDPPSDLRLAVTKRDTKDSPWGVPVSLGPLVNSWSCQDTPWISSDGLLLVFSDPWICSPRPGGVGGQDIWFTRRATKNADWGTPVNLGPPVNTLLEEYCPMISADGSTLYFTTYRYDGLAEDLCQAAIIPIVDFNGDGKVDTADLVMLIDGWGTADKLYDIGPMPWGDGIVDVEDLKVFIKYWEQENTPGNPVQ